MIVVRQGENCDPGVSYVSRAEIAGRRGEGRDRDDTSRTQKSKPPHSESGRTGRRGGRPGRFRRCAVRTVPRTATDRAWQPRPGRCRGPRQTVRGSLGPDGRRGARGCLLAVFVGEGLLAPSILSPSTRSWSPGGWSRGAVARVPAGTLESPSRRPAAAVTGSAFLLMGGACSTRRHCSSSQHWNLCR